MNGLAICCYARIEFKIGGANVTLSLQWYNRNCYAVTSLLCSNLYINMKVLLVIHLLVLLCAWLSESAIVGDASKINRQHLFYEEQSKILYELLEKECPGEVESRRNANDEEFSTILEVKKRLMNALEQKLINCRTEKNKTPSTTALATAKLTTTATSTTSPSQCLSATNLTDSWRMDHDGKNLKGRGPNAVSGWACDFRKSLQWFRFTGAAGKNNKS